MAFYENMRGLFRKTDLVSVEDEKLYCLLSKTSKAHLEVIENRVRSFKPKDNLDHPMDIRFGFLSSQEIVAGGLTQEMLINELLNRVRSWCIFY